MPTIYQSLEWWSRLRPANFKALPSLWCYQWDGYNPLRCLRPPLRPWSIWPISRSRLRHLQVLIIWILCPNLWPPCLNLHLARRWLCPPCLCPLNPPSPRGCHVPPVKSWDVYVDDFSDMVQGTWQHRRRIKRVLLHTLDKIFRPLDLKDNKHRQEPASVKKM
jgi:hypothetical protein